MVIVPVFTRNYRQCAPRDENSVVCSSASQRKGRSGSITRGQVGDRAALWGSHPNQVSPFPFGLGGECIWHHRRLNDALTNSGSAEAFPGRSDAGRNLCRVISDSSRYGLGTNSGPRRSRVVASDLSHRVRPLDDLPGYFLRPRSKNCQTVPTARVVLFDDTTSLNAELVRGSACTGYALPNLILAALVHRA